jgi:hypothetical protein
LINHKTAPLLHSKQKPFPAIFTTSIQPVAIFPLPFQTCKYSLPFQFQFTITITYMATILFHCSSLPANQSKPHLTVPPLPKPPYQSALPVPSAAISTNNHTISQIPKPIHHHFFQNQLTP